MVINDKLKGEFYRTPLTKLASRNNVLTTLNELIEYFNKLSELIDSNFQKITDTRNAMKVNLLTIYERTKHFKYVLDHFKIDVDSHITERLNDAIENFQNKITTFVTPYEANLFNHSCVTDDVISNKVDTNAVEDWDRSINMLASELGIRWFGGKISDKSLITELDNILHITKVNTYEGYNNEDYINSNLILDIFLYTSKGITWLSLGKNGDFGYNIIVKYQSKESPFNLKVLSETYNNRKEFDINTYDFDMILNTLLSRSDIKNGNVYIKVKTNIPSNTESGREGYFLTSSKKFNDHEVKKGISEFARGLMYHDNKDVAYFEHADDNIYDIKQKTSEKTETNSILNARSDEVKDFETDSKEKQFYSEISNIGEEKYVQSIYNPDEVKMNELMDIVSGFIISNTDTEVKKNYLEGVKLNKKYDNGDPVKYTKGETVVDISDPSFVGDLSLMAKNENMFAVENSFSKSKVVPSQFKYGTEISSETVENTFTNDESFADINDNSYTQDADILLTPVIEQNSIIYKVVKVTDYDILILKSDGIYRFNSRDKLSGDSFTEKINQNNLFNVCYDAVVNGKIVYLATDVGVCKMNTQSFVVERTGVVGGSWCKLFETFDKTNVIAIRKDFSTNLDNGKISYGESVAMTNGGNFNTLKVIFQDNKYFTYDNPALDNELTKTERALDYTNKRNFQEEFKVLHNPIENRYYFFRYGHKMLYTDNPSDPSMKFANFKIVSAMKDYDISDALIFENKIYFTVYEGGNYYYDLNTNTVHPVEYTTTKVINNRNTTYKSYYMSKLSNLVNDNADSTGIVDKYVLLTPEELAAGYVEGTKYFYPSIKTLHLCSVEEKMNGPDPNIDYYGCIGTTFGVIGSWFIGKVTSFNNIDKHGVYNPDMNYGYVEFANDGKYLDYTLAVATEGFMMDPSKIHKLVHVEEELSKINCFLKVANGKLFFIPNNPDNEIRNLVYVNGYYYFATNQDYIFKLDEHFNIINQIRSEDCNEIFGAGNLLVIQNNSVTSEEITKSEAYYDRVDGSEMIEGYNPDVEYYLEKNYTRTKTTYENISQEDYDAIKTLTIKGWWQPFDLRMIGMTEWGIKPYNLVNGKTINSIEDVYTLTNGKPYLYRQSFDDSWIYTNLYSLRSNGNGYDQINAPTYEFERVRRPITDEEWENRTVDGAGTLHTSDGCDIVKYFEESGTYNNAYENTSTKDNVCMVDTVGTLTIPKEDLFIQVKTPVIEKRMTRANVNNPEDFVLTPKYNVIDSATRAQGIQNGVDYFVSRELPDKEYYDHIEPEAKTIGYDSRTFVPSEYFIGDLIKFASVPVEEREGKPLYASNNEGTNYVLVDYYREGTTVLDDINNFYTVADTYTQCEENDFNHGFEFIKVNIDETPNPVDGVSYYIKVDQPDPNTGIPYVDAGIGGETLYAFDITKEYYVAYRLLYHFKDDNAFGYQKTYFHKRIEDSGVEYIKAEKENGDFLATDVYTELTQEEKEEGPQKGVDYYVHPTVMKDIFTKLLDKSSGVQSGVKYYKMNGTPTEVYTPLTTEEMNNGPQEGEVYYIFDGGIWVEKPYASLEDGTDNNKIFSEGYVYNKKSYDYSGVEYVLCTDEDFNITTSLKSIIDFYETKDELYISKRQSNSPLRELYSIDKNTLSESELLCYFDDLSGNSTLYKNDKIFYTEYGIYAIEKDIQTNKNMLRVIYDTSSPDTPMGQISGNNDDVFIINRIDGADGYEVYLYDYSTNAVRKATGIDESLEYGNELRINTKDNETFVVNRKKVYLFNKKLVKDENNNYSYTYKYKGIYKNGVYEDWTTTDFVLFMDYSDSVNFTFDYSNLLENKNGVVSGCLAVNCYNKETSFSSIAFYTMDNEYSLKLVAFKDYTKFVPGQIGSTEEFSERSEDHMSLIGYKDENNRCIFISEILFDGIRFDVDVYDNPQFSDTENTEKIKHKLIRFNHDNTETNAILNNEHYCINGIKFVGTYMIEGIKYLRFALLGTDTTNSILTFFNLNISDQLTASSTFKYGFYSYDDESIFTMKYVTRGDIKENHVIFDLEYDSSDSGNHVVETRCFDFDYKFANSNKQIVLVENTNKTSYLVCVKEQEDDEYIYRIYKFDNGSFIPTDKVLTIRDSRNEEFVDILWDKKIYSNNDLSNILIFNRRDRTIIDGDDSISFKEDIDYYTKSQVEELNTSSYVKNDTFGYTTISNSLNEIGNSLNEIGNISMLQAHDIYNDVDTLYIRKGTGSTVEMYKLTDNMSEPTKLFSVDLGSVNVSNLLYTNGKLFVFDNGVIIDYLQNEQRTWSPITSDQNWDSDYNSAVMCGNNLVLIKRITEDVPDKDKFEIYYYDYTTRDLQKASEIPATRFSPKIRVTKNNILIFVTDDNNRTTCYIFNKQFTKVENTLNQYTSSSKYSGTVDSTGTINDYSSNVFIPLPFTQDTYIGNVLCDYLDSNGILFIGTFNGVAIFKSNENNQIVNSLYVRNIDYIGGDYINTTSTIFRDEDSNNYYFIYNEASGRSFKILVYKNPGITDNETEKQKISVIWDDGETDGENGPLFGGDTNVSQYIVGKYTTIDENDRTHEFLKIYVYLSPVIDHVVKRKFTFVNLDITDINDPNYMTNSREMLKYSFDGINDSTFSEVYDEIFRQENYILCYKENPQTLDCYDFYYKIINSGKHVVAISEPYTKLDSYDQYETPIFNQDQTKLLLVKEDDDSYRIYTFDGDEILPTDNYIESTDDISVNNQDTNNWWFFRLITLNGDNENYLTLINGVDLIKNTSKFEENKQYYTKETTYDFFPEVSYYLKSMMVNFKLELEYFTKRIRTIVQDVISHARSYTSTDKTSKLFHKSLIKIKDNSLKVLMNVLTK